MRYLIRRYPTPATYTFRMRKDHRSHTTAMEKIGAFALTDPHGGSDVAGGLETTARREGDAWVLSGAKRWIGNATFADLVIVWVRDEPDGHVKGFVVEKGSPGLPPRSASSAGSSPTPRRSTPTKAPDWVGVRRGRDRKERQMPARRTSEPGSGGLPPARSALTLRLILAAFGLTVFVAATVISILLSVPYGVTAGFAVFALIALVNLLVVAGRKHHGRS
jgi:hypothetical protein